jgi:hypothetical protein
MTSQVKNLFDSFGLFNKVIGYVKTNGQIWAHWPLPY